MQTREQKAQTSVAIKQLFGVENNTAFYVGEYAGQAGVIIGSSAFTGGVTGGLMLAGNAATAINGVQILVPVITTASAMNQSTTGNIVKEASGAKGAGGAGEETVTYRRVQGGQGTKSSKPRISVDETGKVSIPNKSKDLNISVDGGEHSQYFQGKRPGSDIVEFDVPKWLDDFVNESSIPQAGAKSNPLNQGATVLKVTDLTTPGKSIEFPAPWIDWIEEYATNGRIINEVHNVKVIPEYAENIIVAVIENKDFSWYIPSLPLVMSKRSPHGLRFSL